MGFPDPAHQAWPARQIMTQRPHQAGLAQQAA